MKLSDFLRAAGLSGWRMIPKLKETLARYLETDSGAFVVAVAEVRASRDRTRDLNRRSYNSTTSYF